MWRPLRRAIVPTGLVGSCYPGLGRQKSAVEFSAGCVMRSLASVRLFHEIFVDGPSSLICPSDCLFVDQGRIPIGACDPEFPLLHINASESDLRACVIQRKISGGTMSADGRVARDLMLGLPKTCLKLGLSFFAYLGDRPGIPPLADLVIRAA